MEMHSSARSAVGRMLCGHVARRSGPNESDDAQWLPPLQPSPQVKAGAFAAAAGTDTEREKSGAASGASEFDTPRLAGTERFDPIALGTSGETCAGAAGSGLGEQAMLAIGDRGWTVGVEPDPTTEGSG